MENKSKENIGWFILIFIITLILMSCEPSDFQSTDTQVDPDDRSLSSTPIKSRDTTKLPLEVIGVYNTEGGNLYVYKFGNDTIYWAEGRSSSYPVGLQVK